MSAERPNVILITADQFRGDALYSAGNPYIQTPHLDQLGYAGARFSGAFSECPICVAGRLCLMTGKSPWATGVYSNSKVENWSHAFLAEAFGRHGYQTQAVGKLHVTPQRRRIGFDHVLLNEEGRREGKLRLDDYEMYLQEKGLLQQLWAHGMPANGLQSRPATLPEEHISDAWTAREACRFLERRDTTQPFFLYVSFRNPHPPLTPAQVYWDLYRDRPVRAPVRGEWVGRREPSNLAFNRARNNCDLQPEAERLQAIRAYYALITGIDHQIGVLTGELRERGLAHNTAILFTADHGEMLFDHDAAHKSMFYQASARIPMLLSVPEGVRETRPGLVIDRPVMLQDVMPTLLDAAGLPVPEGVEGRSMLPLLQDSGAPWREHAVGCFGRHTYGITDNRFRYIYWLDGGLEQLFDCVNDPDERVDLAEDPKYAVELKAFRARLVDELARREDDNLQGGKLASKEPRPFDERVARRSSGWNVRGLHWPSI
ncbi:MAG: sulfatase-like hydrolase/transferase [Planctomycetota bacterium]|nr:sulfatase-like hydrolase/transferase [Planctomycetota bacterium]